MKVPAKARYAMLAAMVLAKTYEDKGFLPTRLIAKRANIPGKYVIQIFQVLRGKGIIVSQQGKEGGYRLATSPDRISLADVFEAAQGELLEVDMDSEEMKAPYGQVLADAIHLARDEAGKVLKSMSLETIIRNADALSDGSTMYYI